MTFRSMLLSGCAVAAALTFSAPAHAAYVQACPLDGVATLTPGLTANQPLPTTDGVDWGPAFTYSFHGDLGDCLAGFAGYEPGDASRIYAGEAITIAGTQYDWPAELGTPHGNGGCTGSHTEGTALLVGDGASGSIIDYSTDGAAAAIGLTGSYGSKTILLSSKAKNPDGTPVSTLQFHASEFAGHYAGGLLAFEPEDPTLCTSTGVTESPISGFIGHGTYQ